MPPKRQRPERELTDRSLAGERGKTDDELARRAARLEENADEVVDQARRRADDVLARARATADERFGDAGAAPDARAALATERRREAERIRHQAALMARLVDDLLDVSSIEAGRLAIRPSRNEPTELLREAEDASGPIAGARGISIRTEVKAGTQLAEYDHERILQVLTNLLGNAIKFSPRGGRVDLLVEPVGGEIRFAVSDTGCGIAPDQLDVIFERFRQATTQERTGLGLGLYIARSIVEAHGGRMWAESRPGEGSTFYFTLPAATPASVANPP